MTIFRCDRASTKGLQIAQKPCECVDTVDASEDERRVSSHRVYSWPCAGACLEDPRSVDNCDLSDAVRVVGQQDIDEPDDDPRVQITKAKAVDVQQDAKVRRGVSLRRVSRRR